MQHASVTVAPDRSAQVTADCRTTDHPDLGAALAHLTQTAEDAHTPISVAISDGTTLRGLTITADGGISAAEAPLADAPAAPLRGSAPTLPLGAAPTAASGASDPDSTSVSDALRGPVPVATETAAGLLGTSGAVDPSYPTGTPFSGPAEPAPEAQIARVSDPRTPAPRSAGTDRDRRASDRAAARAAARPKRTGPHDGPTTSSSRRASPRLTAPSIVLIALLVLASVLFFLPNFIGTPTPESSGPPAQTQAPTRSPLTVADATTPVPGFSSEAAWNAEVPQNASVTATSRGVLVVDGDDLTILDPKDGSVRYTDTHDEPITFAADTEVGGRKALVWQYGTEARALQDGSSTAIEYELPRNAQLSSAGTSVLIRDGNALSTLGPEGLTPIPTPAPGTTPMALDGDELISAPFEGPIIRTDITTGDQTEVPLESPGDGLEITQWKSAGHGLAISIWGAPGATVNSGHRLQLVVHSLEDGAVSSVNEVSSAEVGESPWVRGQGYQLAQVGPYLYSLDTGLLVLDGTESGMQFGEPRGALVPGTLESEPVIASGMQSSAPTAFRTAAELLAVTDDGRVAITRTSADLLTAYRTN